jgi:hypothetical protein
MLYFFANFPAVQAFLSAIMHWPTQLSDRQRPLSHSQKGTFVPPLPPTQHLECRLLHLQIFGLVARAQLFVRAEDPVDDGGLFGIEIRQQFEMGAADDIKRRPILRFCQNSGAKGLRQAAGIVEATGSNVGSVSVDDEVFGTVDFKKSGGFAEAVVVEASHMAKKPPQLSFAEAASLPLPR